MAEFRAAIHALVEHPNTPPFMAKQLIQKTVTSSPTPEYVARVAAVFRNNGYGIRGDLAAVTRAILLDPEARGARKIDREYGRMREPMLLWTAMIRALDVTTDGAMPQGTSCGVAGRTYSKRRRCSTTTPPTTRWPVEARARPRNSRSVPSAERKQREPDQRPALQRGPDVVDERTLRVGAASLCAECAGNTESATHGVPAGRQQWPMYWSSA